MNRKNTGRLFLAVIFILSANLAANAQPTFTDLHTFTFSNDGEYPFGSLILSSNKLYGTTESGGSKGLGAVFMVNVDGTGYTNIHSFSMIVYDPSSLSETNSDGVDPQAGLIISGNTLYGTANQGGSKGQGTVFRVNTDGSGFTNLHSFTTRSNSSPFTNSDGAHPTASLVLSGNTLFGTAEVGGSLGQGAIFAVNTDGSGFTNIHNFTSGGNPATGLTLSGNTLFGTAGGGFGMVYKINTDGSGFSIVHGFGGSDGAYPYAGLIISGNTLFGTTQGGGNPGYDTIFAVNTNGLVFTNLYRFTALPNYNSYATNSDGAAPRASLIIFSNVLYGATGAGGNFGQGTVFKINTDGSGFQNLYNFTALNPNNPNYTGTNSDGANPQSGLILSGGILYGTAENGGSLGEGTLFSLSLVPSLGIAPQGNQIVISWPTWSCCLWLQMVSNTASGSWSNITNGINIAGGNYVFTNTMNGNSVFFRLKQ